MPSYYTRVCSVAELASSITNTSVRVKLLRECFFTDLHEGLNNDFVVTRRIQLKKALKKLLKIGFCVHLSLQYHLEDGISEIFMWVIRILLNGNATNKFCARFWNLIIMIDLGVLVIVIGFGDGGGSGGEVFVFVVVAVAVPGSSGGGGGRSEAVRVCVCV